jgi:hypothetical protein
MFLRLLLLIAMTTCIEAEVVEASYEVSYGIFGKIGIANARLERREGSYIIEIELRATGLAKMLSKGRKEYHCSQGRIKRGLLIADLYRVEKSHGDSVMEKSYRFDHEKRRVFKEFRKYKEGKERRHEEGYLDFYSRDDLLTLYFNLDAKIKDKTTPNLYAFTSVGAERQGGKVSVEIPTKAKLNHYYEMLGEGASWYATAIIHQKIFSSKEGRLMLAVGSDGITNKAVLKDVIFFGDIRAKRIE